jgi:hypothetical protein
MPNQTRADARATAHAYHQHWTHRRFDEAIALLDPELAVEVPINAYPTREAFGAALSKFGAMTESVQLLSELGGEDEAMLLYDLEAPGLGTLRVAEHFTVRDGKIVRLRQIHDTAPVRAAGLGGAG